jgi:hypothetical protein
MRHRHHAPGIVMEDDLQVAILASQAVASITRYMSPAVIDEMRQDAHHMPPS